MTSEKRRYLKIVVEPNKVTLKLRFRNKAEKASEELTGVYIRDLMYFADKVKKYIDRGYDFCGKSSSNPKKNFITVVMEKERH